MLGKSLSHHASSARPVLAQAIKSKLPMAPMGYSRLMSSASFPTGNNDQDEAPNKGPGMYWTRRLFHDERSLNRRYNWVTEEAEKLIEDAYKIHLPGKPFPPSLETDRSRLEELDDFPHLVPVTLSDKVAYRSVLFLEWVMNLFFREKYDHHAVTLETVAAVPGFVGGMWRHLRSLRRMKRDHGWIDNLLEESQNERMHLLIWMQHTQPNAVERAFVLVAQGLYVGFYSGMYAVSPKTAHRMVGYLEECAIRAYTDYLRAVDEGKIPNMPLAQRSIAKRYYRLPDDATLRDVILHVRADEFFHSIYNHGLANQIRDGGIDNDPEDNLYASKQDNNTPSPSA